MLRAASVLTVIAPMPRECPKRLRGTGRPTQPTVRSGRATRLISPALRGGGASGTRKRLGPRPHQGPTQPQQPSELLAELREVGRLAAGSWVSGASRPGHNRGFRRLHEQDPAPGCTRPLSSRAGGGHWRGREPRLFSISSPVLPEWALLSVHGHRRGPLPSSVSRPRPGVQPPGSCALPRPDLHTPQVRRARRRHLPNPLSKTDSLLFCASARFLWRGRSRDSSRARASAPCISPMAADRGARSGRRRPASTDVSLKEPP